MILLTTFFRHQMPQKCTECAQIMHGMHRMEWRREEMELTVLGSHVVLTWTLCDSDMWGSELSFRARESCVPFLSPSNRPCLPASFRHYGHGPTRSTVSALGRPFLAVRCSAYSEVDGSKGNEVLVLQSTNVRTDSGPRPPNQR